MNGPNPISLLDVDAYSRFYRAVLSLYEVKMVRRIDDLYLGAYSSARSSG